MLLNGFAMRVQRLLAKIGVFKVTPGWVSTQMALQCGLRDSVASSHFVTIISVFPIPKRFHRVSSTVSRVKSVYDGCGNWRYEAVRARMRCLYASCSARIRGMVRVEWLRRVPVECLRKLVRESCLRSGTEVSILFARRIGAC